MSNKYELSEVTAASYLKGKTQYLVHAVDAHGAVCGRVNRDNLTGYANPKHSQPTCGRCLERWKYGI